MKKLYTSIFCALVVLGANAQTNLSAGRPTPNVPQPGARFQPVPSTQSMQTFYIDYDYSDSIYALDTMGTAYSRFIWDMNMNFDATQGDTSRRYAEVEYHTFIDSYNGDVLMPSSMFNSYTVDTVWINCGHVNNSGLADTIIVNLYSIGGNGYPTSTVIGTGQTIANNFTSGTSWLQSQWVPVPMNWAAPSANTKFAARVEYWGPKVDTFGIVAGFQDLGSGLCTAIPQLQNFAEYSKFYVNSYYWDTRYGATYGMFPTSTGISLYYPCDGNQTFDAGVDSPYFIQNWMIVPQITVDGVGINEFANTGIALDQNVPNPAVNGTTLINYQIANSAENVTLEVYDVTGNLVQSVNQGQKTAGLHNVVLNTTSYGSGVYFYTLNVDGVKVTRKMVIGE